MKFPKNSLKTLTFLLGIGYGLLTSSCMSPSTISQSGEIKKKKLTREYFESRFKKLSEELKGNKNLLKHGKKAEKSLEWYLDAGSIAHYAYHLKTSFKIWDFADTQINIYEQKVLGEKAAREIASLLINDWVKDYTPPIYERVFLNLFQAFNDLSLQNFEDANIELNRAISRLKHAEKIFKKEIERQEREAKNEKKEKHIYFSKKTVEPIEKAYSILDKYKPYSKFENPLVYYLKGILYLEQGDYNNAAEMFKITYGLIKDREPAAEQVEKDWELAQNLNDGKHHLWVIYLNGLSFEKVEKILVIPLFLVTNEVLYVSAAFPQLRERYKTSTTLLIKKQNNIVKTKRLVDINSLIAWEFKKRLPPIITKEITRAFVKALIQYEFGKYIGALYQAITTHADTRQWYWLPKEVQIARVDFEPGKPIILKVPGHKPKKFVFSKDVKDAIIVVRGFKPQDEVWYYEIPFKE